MKITLKEKKSNTMMFDNLNLDNVKLIRVNVKAWDKFLKTKKGKQYIKDLNKAWAEVDNKKLNFRPICGFDVSDS